MFKEFFKLVLANAVRSWLSSPSYAHERPSPLHLNTEQIKAHAIRIGSLVTLLYLNFLLFVGGLIVTIVALANSLDVHDGKFVSTGVFWSGIIMMFTALAIGALSGWALGQTKLELKEFIIAEPEIEPATVKDRIFTPFLEGLVEGFRRPSGTTYDERYPAA